MKAENKPRIDLKNRTKLETVIPLSVPFIINIDPSDVCNFQCKFCPTADRELMKATPGRKFGLMDFGLYKKIIDDICEFERPIKVLRLYKDGEPLLHPQFVDMVEYARAKKCSERIDTTTNASRLNPHVNARLARAGLDRINISIYGMNEVQYLDFSKARIKFNALVANIRDFYEQRGNCEVIIKIIGDVISEDDVKRFFEVFSDIADGINVDHIMSCWPEFDLEKYGITVNREVGVYGQRLTGEVKVCPYIFYSFSINSNGSASSCFLDWERKLIIGDAKTESVKDIWHGAKLLAHQKMMLMKQRKQHPVCGNCGQMTHGMPDNIDHHAEELLKKFKTS